MINQAEVRRRAEGLIKRLRTAMLGEHRVVLKHLVAVLSMTVQDGPLLLVYNHLSAPLHAAPVERVKDLFQIRLSSLQTFDLNQVDNVFLALPAVACVRPALSAQSPGFVDLAEMLYDDAGAPILTATKQTLAAALANFAKSPHQLGMGPQAIRGHVHRLLLSMLLVDLPVHGLLGVIPGPELMKSHYDATLLYWNGDKVELPHGTFHVKALTLEQAIMEAVERVPASQPQTIFIASSLRSMLPDSARAEPLERLLDDARRSSAWAPTRALLEEKVSQLRIQRGMKERPPFFFDSPKLPAFLRDPWAPPPSTPRLDRVHRAELAYVLAELTARRMARERGAERLIQGAKDRFLDVLREGQDNNLKQYFEALQLFYQLGEHHESDVPERIRTLQEKLRYLTDIEDGPPQARATLLLRLLTIAVALANDSASEPLVDQIKALIPAPGTGTYAAYEPHTTGKLDFALVTIARQMVSVAVRAKEIHLAEGAASAAIDRAATLQTLAAKVRALPRFIARLPHERAILTYVCNKLATMAQELAHGLTGGPFLKVRLVTEQITMNEPNDLLIEVKNQSDTYAAINVTLELYFPRHLSTIEGTTLTLARVAPLKTVTERIEVTGQYQGTALLRIDVDYRSSGVDSTPDRGRVHREQLSLSVDVRPTQKSLPPLPLVRPLYPAGHHVESFRQFYGRRAELRRLANLFAALKKETFLVLGPRRTGKTSFIKMIELILTRKEARRHFEIPSAWDTILDLHIPVFFDLLNISNTPTEKSFCRSLYENAYTAVQFKKRMDAPSLYARDTTSMPLLEHALNILLTALPANARLVFLLDEVDVIHGLGVAGLYAQLRALFERHERLLWVLVSARGLHGETQYGSPLFNVVQSIDLRHLSRDETKALVSGPTQGVLFDDDAANEVYQLTSGHPYITNILCNHVMEVLYAHGVSRVKRWMVEEASKAVVKAEGHSKFSFVWKDATPIAQAALAVMAFSRTQMSAHDVLSEIKRFDKIPSHVLSNVDEGLVIRALEALDAKGVLEHDATGWRFSVPLVKTWLRVLVLESPPGSWLGERS